MQAIRVLLIDDEPELLELSKLMLERGKGISVVTASSAARALELIDLDDFDVVVSDYRMPGKDGIQLLKEIRESNNRIPFILFTGRGREEVVIEALNNGADFYLQKGGDTKPQFAELINMIKQAHSKKEGEKMLLISEERYRSLFQNSVDAVILSTIDGGIISANPSACQLFGKTESDLRMHNIEDMIENGKWKEALRIGKRIGMVNRDFCFKKNDGSTFIGDSNLGFFLGPDSNARISIIVRDNTEKQKKVEELKASEEKYRRLFETAQEGILILDFEKEIIIDANKFILDLTGYSLEEVLDKRLWELGFMKDKALADEAFSHLRSEGYMRYEDIPLRRKNGEIVPVEFVINVYLVDNTEIIQCNIRDISERVLRDTKIKELANIVDSTTDAIIGKDLNGSITSWNKGAEGIYGYVQEEIVGKPILLLAAPDSKDEMENNLTRILQGEILTHFESTHVRKNGSRVDVSLTVAAVHNSEGTIIGSSTIASDITERKRLDIALQQANVKLNLLSSITRHDIKNQLMVLRGNLELQEKDRLEILSDSYHQQVKKASERISTTIEFTKLYEDIGIQKPVWHDLRDLVEEAKGDVPLGKVKVSNECPSGFEFFADPLILKVFDNLLDNAIRHGRNVSAIRFYVAEQEGVHSIICEDDGAGVEVEMKEKLFTRGFGKNNGLGLFLCREIVSITGITLKETGMPGLGARFVLELPLGGNRYKNSQPT